MNTSDDELRRLGFSLPTNPAADPAIMARVAVMSPFAQQAMVALQQSALMAEQAVATPALATARRAIEAAYALRAEATRVEEQLRRSYPEVVGLLGPDEMDQAAAIAQGEGIPVAWVPRVSLIRDLIGLPDESSRLAYLEAHVDEVVEDCRTVAENAATRWMGEALEAVDVLSEGHWTPAQSHAANIVDTIVLELGRRAGYANGQLKRARDDAVATASLPLDDDAPMTNVAQAFAMMPLLRALEHWWPGTPPPIRFSRHATAHAIGESGVSTRALALVSVMLATSLARQFGA